jgi:hypothetical protein
MVVVVFGRKRVSDKAMEGVGGVLTFHSTSIKRGINPDHEDGSC